MSKIKQLAIIIPAFKRKYLRQTLESIAVQSNRNFHLYIGDDNSPEDLFSVVNDFESRIQLSYHRFEENMGSVSLTQQWERCVDLSHEEKYIWLFSDDDLMPADAVERFYKVVEEDDQFPVYRFNLALINSCNRIINRNMTFPEKETGLDFIIRRLKFQVHSAVIEFIYTREVYEQSSGYIEFPLAWSSDTATQAHFATNSFIFSIPGEPILWRTFDSNNISSSNKYDDQKLTAQLLFVNWLSETYANDFFQSYFRKLVISYLIKVCTQMLTDITRDQINKARNLVKEKYGILISRYFIIWMFLNQNIYQPYRLYRRRLRSLIKGAGV